MAKDVVKEVYEGVAKQLDSIYSAMYAGTYHPVSPDQNEVDKLMESVIEDEFEVKTA